jgi:hypothetical protein
MTSTNLPTVSVSLDELGIVRDYRIYDKWVRPSKIIKGNYLYSAGLFYNTNTKKGELAISKYDLSTKLLMIVTNLDLAQIFPKLASVNYIASDVLSKNIKWLFQTEDELTLIVAVVYTPKTAGNFLCIISTVKLKALDLSITDVSEREVDITPNKEAFINMTFGKNKLRPESWFRDLHMTFSYDIVLYPCYDQLKATFNVKLSNGRMFVGGLNERLNYKPLWFAISCCSYFNTCLHASTELKDFYFGYGEKQHEDNTIGRFYTIKFNENLSKAELKYTDNFIRIPVPWDRKISVKDCNSIIFMDSSFVKKGYLVIMTFYDPGTAVYRIPVIDIIDTKNNDFVVWNFYYDLFEKFIYFVCYASTGSATVLGYIKLDHNSKKATIYITNRVNTGQYRAHYHGMVNIHRCPGYLCFTKGYQGNPDALILLPVQWLHDNIVKSETFSPEIYEFDKKETYEVRRAE